MFELEHHLRATLAALLAVAALAPAAVRADEAQQLLATADSVRNPDHDFAATITLTEYRNGSVVDNSALTVYSKLVPGAAQYDNLVRFIAPVNEVGKLILRHGVDLWFYDPASKASVRISPQARLLGQASNSDVMSTNLSAAYAAKVLGHEPLMDEQKVSHDCVKLRLTPKRADAPYPIVDYWVDAQTKQPLKAKLYSAEERLLKTAYFRRYETHAGHARPTETVIVDGLDPKWITVLRTTDVRPRDVPDAWLQRDYLQHFAGDE